MTLYIVLPVYNEEKNIARLLTGLKSRLSAEAYKVIVVDDGSTDRSLPLVQSFQDKLPIEIVVHPVNKGLAATLNDGLRQAAEAADSSDIIVVMDADNTHSPESIKMMVNKINGGDDVVVASRFVEGGGQKGLPALRKVLSRGASFLVGLFFPLRGVRDYTSGYRAYRASLLKKFFNIYGNKAIEARTFAVAVELLIKLKKLGAKISAVPLMLRYDWKGGKSKLKILPTILESLKILWGNL